MSRWVPVHRANFVHEELTDEQWVNFDLVESICVPIKGGESRLVWTDASWVDVKETPEQLLLLQGAD